MHRQAIIVPSIPIVHLELLLQLYHVLFHVANFADNSCKLCKFIIGSEVVSAQLSVLYERTDASGRQDVYGWECRRYTSCPNITSAFFFFFFFEGGL